jgi:tRNA(adenine34) deaminase
MTALLSDADLAALRVAITQSRLATAGGHQPYGAVLVAPDGRTLATAHNTQGDPSDLTGHAEMNLVRDAARALGPDALQGAVVYASGEPCPMCAGALYWAGVKRVVFALSVDSMRELNGADSVLPLGCAAVMAGGTRKVQVDGPALEDEARAVFARA